MYYRVHRIALIMPLLKSIAIAPFFLTKSSIFITEVLNLDFNHDETNEKHTQKFSTSRLEGCGRDFFTRLAGNVRLPILQV